MWAQSGPDFSPRHFSHFLLYLRAQPGDTGDVVCACVRVCVRARTKVELGPAQLGRLGLQLPLLLPQPADAPAPRQP